MTQQFGFMQPRNGNGEVNPLQFAIRQILRGEVSTAKIVEVMAVDTSAQTVDVQPLVQQVTPEGTPVPHGIIHEVPYGYEQAGNCLIQIDPVVGDIGIAVFADRDITRVKRTKQAATPQTLRAHHMSDALYARTLWASQKPAHKIVFDQKNGIAITSSVTVTVNAATQFNGDMQVQGDITATGTVTGQTDVKAASISGKSHTHPVSDAPGTTGAPE